MSNKAFGTSFPPQEGNGKLYVDVEIHDGVRWISMNDHYLYVLGARTLEETTQALHRHSVKSSMFDGEYVTHTTKGNVTEVIEVYILGTDQVHVGDNMERLTAAFGQSTYMIRRTFGKDRETWNCFPAEYNFRRGQTMIHNTRATMTFNVPRLPKVYREVVE